MKLDSVLHASFSTISFALVLLGVGGVFSGCQPALPSASAESRRTGCQEMPWAFERATVQGVVPGLASNLRGVDTYRLTARGELSGLPTGEETRWFLQMDSILLPAQRVAPGEPRGEGSAAGGSWGWVATRYRYAEGADATHRVEPMVYPLHGRAGEEAEVYLVAMAGDRCWRARILEWTVLERIVAE